MGALSSLVSAPLSEYSSRPDIDHRHDQYLHWLRTVVQLSTCQFNRGVIRLGEDRCNEEGCLVSSILPASIWTI